MRISDLVTMCFQNLFRRKFRTILTVLGVVIGTTAIISMVSLGIGINKSNSDLIAGMGNLNIIEVSPAYNDTDKLDDDALDNISKIEFVDGVTPFVRPYNEGIYEGRIFTGKKDRYATDIWSVIGVYPDGLSKIGYEIGEGEMFKRGGTRPRVIDVVVGVDVPYMFTDTKRGPRDNMINPFDDLGNPQDPFFQPMDASMVLKIPVDTDFDGDYNKSGIKFLEYDMRIVGILAGGESDSYEVRNSIYIDALDLRKIATDYKKESKIRDREQNEYGEVRVHVDDIAKVSDVQKEIESYNFHTYSMEGQRQQALQETQKLQIILGGLGGISLLVAAISIANTMVMSVYERTREIGIMKVLGCFVHDIRTVFLVEAAIIGFSGGLLGVGLSYLISFFLNRFGGSIGQSMGAITMYGEEGIGAISIIPFWLVLVGMAFATSIGILAGIYPAHRAVKISALEAIRTD